MRLPFYSCLLLIILLSVKVKGQGCSDAGFCSIGSLKPTVDTDTTDLSNSIAVGVAYGIGLEKTQTVTSYIEYQHKFSKSLSIQSKITGGYSNGDLGTNFGAGDLFISGNYLFPSSNKNKFSLLAGIKIPLNNSNNTNSDNLPLPLDYQSSIGTYDVIAGMKYSIKKFSFSSGVQIPFKQVNENTFFPQFYQDTLAYKYTPTNGFERKSDLLFRITYSVANSNKNLVLQPNILAIYHLGDDTYMNTFGQKTTIENSAGLTLNAGVTLTKNLKNYHQLEFLFAAPLVVREVRPDGLTRSLVLNVQYKIPF